MKKGIVLGVLLTALFGLGNNKAFAENRFIQSLDCIALNTYGAAKLIYNPQKNEIISNINNGAMKLALANPYYAVTSVALPEFGVNSPMYSTINMDSPGERALGEHVSYHIYFSKLISDTAMHEIHGVLYRTVGFNTPVSHSPVATVDCKVSLR